MEDRILAMCELSNDLLFHKIPRERLGYYVDASLEAGRSAAKCFSGRSIRELYEEYGIAIRHAGSGKGSFGVTLRGQAVLSETECAVEVYDESIRTLAESSRYQGRTLTMDEALDAHLAHEFFHFWEFHEHSSIVDRLEGVTSFSLFGWKRTAHIHRCGEIAAHAFAKQVAALPELPNLYDYLYLIYTGKMTSAQFDALLARMRAMLGADEEKENIRSMEGSGT